MSRPTPTPALGWARAWRIARRDLNARFRGLRLLFLCLFLGVATLAAIGSLTAALTGELAARGQLLLGGDVEMAISQREANADEKAAFAALGEMSETLRMRAMAQRDDAAADVPAGDVPAADVPAAVLAELKGVDAAYPLYGALTLADGSAAPPLRADSLLIGAGLAERLDVSVGDRLRFGTAVFRIGGIIGDEPDRVGEGFTLGPVALTSIDGVRRTGLIQPGSLYTAKYRLRLPPGPDVEALQEELRRDFRDAGWEVKTRDRAAPGASRFFDRMGQFLTLIGLAALVVAGIGVSNGVASWLAGKRGGIATLKVLGATSGDIARIYLLQIGVVAAAAIGAGLVAGALLPPLLVAALGDALPVRPGLSLHVPALARSAAYGMLIALAFTLPPLARARTRPAASIFREGVEGARGIDRRTVVMIAAAGAGVVLLALAGARDPLFSAIVLAAVTGVLLLLLAMGAGVRRVAARLPRPRAPLRRLALANLHRPGSQTPALVVALGLALTLFVTLAAVQTSLSAEIRRTVPQRAPDHFVLDIPVSQADRFRAIVADRAPDARVNMVPALRGAITAYAGQRVADLDELPDGAWFLRGERGVTYSATLPEGSEIVAGQWWPADHAGPPLVSLDAEAAALLGIGVGDMLGVSVLGREFEARIASLRRINWDTMGFNYIMVFSPDVFAGAPHTLAATISDAGDGGSDGGGMQRALLGAFPGISIIPVGEVIGQVQDLMGQMTSAILAAASVTILAGIAVLVGAIAAARQSRAYDAVIMKLLGATRWQILAAQGIEYALLAALLALLALGLGGLAAWFVIVQVFDFGWAPDWGVVLATLAGGALLTLGIGLAGSIPLMSVRPARALRQL